MTCGLYINGKYGILGILYLSFARFCRRKPIGFKLLGENLASILIFTLEDPNSRSPHPTPYCNLYPYIIQPLPNTIYYGWWFSPNYQQTTLLCKKSRKITYYPSP